MQLGQEEWLDALCVQKVQPNAFVPRRGSPLADGFDLFACEKVDIPPGEMRCVSTGLRFRLPRNTRVKLRSLHSCGSVAPAFVAKSTDSVGVASILVTNSTDHAITLDYGMPVAEMILIGLEDDFGAMDSELDLLVNFFMAVTFH